MANAGRVEVGFRGSAFVGSIAAAVGRVDSGVSRNEAFVASDQGAGLAKGGDGLGVQHGAVDQVGYKVAETNFAGERNVRMGLTVDIVEGIPHQGRKCRNEGFLFRGGVGAG